MSLETWKQCSDLIKFDNSINLLVSLDNVEKFRSAVEVEMSDKFLVIYGLSFKGS